MVYLVQHILFGDNKKQTTDTWNNMDKPLKHYSEPKKPDTQ